MWLRDVSEALRDLRLPLSDSGGPWLELVTMANVRYTIVVGGEPLTFTRDQIESDPGNYFQTYFFGEFSEGARGVRELIVEKDVQLFKLIQAHLRGYEIFPLPDSAIPSYMTRQVALTNLVREAQFYGLALLEERMFAFQLEEANLRASAEANASKAKTYKLAHFKNKEWLMNDISEDGYKTHLSRFLNSSKFQPVNFSSLKCPGYTISISWRDNQVEAPASNLPSECFCALLVSD